MVATGVVVFGTWKAVTMYAQGTQEKVRLMENIWIALVDLKGQLLMQPL